MHTPIVIRRHARFNNNQYRYLIWLLTILLSGCIPNHHSISNEFYSLERLSLEAQDAQQQCLQKREIANMPPQSFTTDGCSYWPDSPWQTCCVEHDKAYWCGGTAKQRQQSDQQLMQCVKATGYPLIAWFMGSGVRIGGHPWLPFPWRWGYGWPWLDPY